MIPAASALPGRLDERGVSWVTALLVTGLAAAGYLVWVWGPIYLVHYEVKQVMRNFANQAVKNSADAPQREAMVRQLATLDRIDFVDEYGRPARVPAVNVRPEQVVWERTASPPTLRIAFEYTRPVRYPLIDRETEVTFQLDQTFDISLADWGAPR
ncbi:MAG TPA: hypothetical protein VFR85_01950 [Anaeromyxobacteraceae bacterium]|nr:hypothetical protein [Anaeromyxobacteraceae bacterium]